MASFSIESNGRIEKTAVYFNGDQLGGVKEVFLNLDEDGTFDAILQYEGKDGELRTKQIFTEYPENLKITEPMFTEQESRQLRLLTIESDGDIDNTTVYLDEEPLEGIVSLLVHIKGGKATPKGIRAMFADKTRVSERDEFRAEATYRNEDDSQSTENIF